MDELKIPEHVAIIMDGNSRWAHKNFLPKKSGHKAGADALEKVLRAADKFRIKYISVYAFSTENWKRPKDEVDNLMQLLDNYLDKYIERYEESNLKIKCIGDILGLPYNLQKKISKLEELTSKKDGLNFVIALNYGGHDEILRAVRNICDKVLNNGLLPHQITENIFESFLDTKNIPNPSLLIRTAGEMRLSNFLLWQIAYCEFYFSNKYWPDFGENDLLDAIKSFSVRSRRFGAR